MIGSDDFDSSVDDSSVENQQALKRARDAGLDEKRTERRERRMAAAAAAVGAMPLGIVVGIAQDDDAVDDAVLGFVQDDDSKCI
jgi:hypothetical protein